MVEVRRLGGDGQQLVHLLLVLGDRKLCFRMGQHIGQFLGNGVLVHRHRNGAKALRRHHRPVKPRPVVAHDGDSVAAAHTEAAQADGEGAHFVRGLPPGPGLPNAEVFQPDSGPLRKHLCVMQQHFRQRVGHYGGTTRE